MNAHLWFWQLMWSFQQPAALQWEVNSIWESPWRQYGSTIQIPWQNWRIWFGWQHQEFPEIWWQNDWLVSLAWRQENWEFRGAEIFLQSSQILLNHALEIRYNGNSSWTWGEDFLLAPQDHCIYAKASVQWRNGEHQSMTMSLQHNPNWGLELQQQLPIDNFGDWRIAIQWPSRRLSLSMGVLWENWGLSAHASQMPQLPMRYQGNFQLWKFHD